MNETANHPPPLVLPPRLRPGDTVGLVAPAGPLLNEETLAAGIRLLRDMGFEVKHGRDLMRRQGYLAGSDQQRAGEFRELWADPEVKALVAVRGGYGSLRMLPLLDMQLFRQHPKVLVGFSDITVLLTAILKQTGLLTFHGPMVTTLAGSDRQSIRFFHDLLNRREMDSLKPEGLEILIAGQVQGRLLGGNLTTLVHLLGTPYELSWQGAILFLEDIGEQPYRIDRMLTHLKEAGRLQGLGGLILGSFKDCGDQEQIWERAVALLQDQKIPLWANFPAGHGKRNHILPLGLEAAMDSRSGVLHFLGPCFA